MVGRGEERSTCPLKILHLSLCVWWWRSRGFARFCRQLIRFHRWHLSSPATELIFSHSPANRLFSCAARLSLTWSRSSIQNLLKMSLAWWPRCLWCIFSLSGSGTTALLPHPSLPSHPSPHIPSLLSTRVQKVRTRHNFARWCIREFSCPEEGRRWLFVPGISPRIACITLNCFLGCNLVVWAQALLLASPPPVLNPDTHTPCTALITVSLAATWPGEDRKGVLSFSNKVCALYGHAWLGLESFHVCQAFYRRFCLLICCLLQSEAYWLW